MVLEAAKKHSRAGEKVKIIAVDSSEQTRRVQEAVARRAYEIFERRGSASSHELEDWRQAEAELVHPCFSGSRVSGIFCGVTSGKNTQRLVGSIWYCLQK